jgi:FtsH-binding integral membrane protein
MSNDPTKPRWPGQQPTSFDPMTGQPLYGDPQQPPQQQWQQPPQQQWQQPPQQQWQQPQQQPWQQQPPPQQWQQPPQQPQWQQPPQQPQYAQNYGQQPPQQPWQQQQGYGQQHNLSYPQQAQGRPDSDADDDDDDDADDSSRNLRREANATVNQSDRLRFIRLTYLHLFGAILVFAGLLWALFNVKFLVMKVSIPFVTFALGGRWNWAVVLVAFMVVSWVADYWASHTTSKAMQYVGLAVYTVAEALIFVPLLAIVQWKTAEIIAKGGGNPNILRDSAITTLAIFAALTASVYITKKDFSFLRSGLMMAGAASVVVVFLALGFGFNLGIVFSVAMVLLASGYVLYQTSQVFAHYHTESYVAAALALFSSIALMFWYVIRIFMRMRQ